MPLRIDLFVDLTDNAFRIDDEAGALPELHALPFGLADTERFHKGGIGIGQKIDFKSELVAKLLVGLDAIGAYAENLDVSFLEVRLAGGEGFALEGAAGCVVLWIEVDYKPLACEVAQLLGFAVLIGKRNAGKGVPAETMDESILSKQV